MQTIGLIGGLSWESSAQYYRIINQQVRARLGGVHSAKSLMVSVDFGEVEALQHAGEWARLGDMMAAAARQLEAGGADFVVLATNTMHILADRIEAAVAIPLLHIADPCGAAIRAAGLSRVALTGTRFTMEGPFYRERLAERFGIECLLPEEDERAEIHRIIYEELVAGEVRESSRERLNAILANLADRGAEGVILGCTEIMLLARQEDSALPLFDTTTLHAVAAVERALS